MSTNLRPVSDAKGFFAARSLALGLVQSVSITMTGVLLDSIAFPAGARAGTVSDDVIWKLGLIPMGGAVLHTIGAYLYRGYRLDRDRHAEITLELTRRRAEAASPNPSGPLLALPCSDSGAAIRLG